MTTAPGLQHHKMLLGILAGVYCTTLVLIPSLSSKFIAIGPLNIVGSTLIFPISFIFNDILTEVYGYERSRRIIWTGFACSALAALMYYLVQIWPAAPFWDNQAAYDAILGQAPRIVLASLSAYFVSEFINSYILSRMKHAQKGKRGFSQGTRFVVSTIFGEAADSVVFMTVAFYGVMANNDLVNTILTIWAVKVAYEVIALPISVPLSNWVKAQEGFDQIDDPKSTNYTPLKF